MLERFVAEKIESSLDLFRVTVVNGPRQSGKTTLVQQITTRHQGSYRSLDAPETLAHALHDPSDFVSTGRTPCAIDEVQRGGNALVLALKERVDIVNKRGMFLLAGSTRFLSVPQLSESLAGRVEVIDIWPLSQGEVHSRKERFLERAFESLFDWAEGSVDRTSRNELFEIVVEGGYPELLGVPTKSRARWYRSYLKTVIERDVVEASAIRQAQELPRLVRLLAANPAGELVASRIAGDLRLGDDVVRRYLGLLEMVGLLTLTPAWLSNFTTREKRHAKASLVDTGLAAAALGLSVESLAAFGAPLAGGFLESFVTMEIRKQCSWSEEPIEIKHWRDRNGAEVDLILETPDGRVVAIETKAGTTTGASDVRHLISLREALGDRFASGVIFHTGERIQRLGDRIWSLPVSALWAY